MGLRKEVEYLWKHYDNDKNGYLEGKELKDFLRDLCAVDELKGKEETVKELIDSNGDGKLDFNELLTALDG